VPILAGPEPALQGFDRFAMLGWAALATAALLALSVLAVARRLISSDTFGVMAVLAAIVSVGAARRLCLCFATTARGSRG
jgi:hypothetical protein